MKNTIRIKNGKIAVVIILLANFLSGCPVEYDVEYVAEIQSNTEWRTKIQGEEIHGFGDQFLSIPPSRGAGVSEYDLPVCITVQKQSIAGYLRARVFVEGTTVLGSHDGEWTFTTADSGQVTACSAD